MVDLFDVVGDRVPRQAQLHPDLGQRGSPLATRSRTALALGQLHPGIALACGLPARREVAITRRAIDGDSGGSPWLMRLSCSMKCSRGFAPGASKSKAAPACSREQVFVVVVDRDDDRLRASPGWLAQGRDHVDPEPSGRPRSICARLEAHGRDQLERVVNVRGFEMFACGKTKAPAP